MRFSIDHATLAPALAFVARMVPTRAVRPVLSSILIEAREGHVTLAATDLETAAVTRLPAVVDREGRIALPSRYLSEMLRRIPGGPMTWNADTSATARISWGRSQFSINGYDTAEYPAIPDFPESTERTLAQGMLRHAILHSAFAAAQGETARALLTGVELRFAGSQLFALATDGFQAAAYATDPTAPRPADGAIVVPATVLQEVSRLLASPDQPCHIAQHGNQILIRAGATYLVARLLEGRYFAVLDLVPKAFPTLVHVDRQSLIGACERVGLICDHEPPHAIAFHAEDHQVHLQASSPDVGTAEESVEATVQGDAVHMGFNARQLIEGLRHFDGPTVSVEISGATTLTRFTDPDDRRLQYMQMPLQMPEQS